MVDKRQRARRGSDQRERRTRNCIVNTDGSLAEEQFKGKRGVLMDEHRHIAIVETDEVELAQLRLTEDILDP